MDRESYDDPEVAQIVNEQFHCGESRSGRAARHRQPIPGGSERHQRAGGWPLTAFLTPDGKPFYGGTYFPPEDQWGRPSFKRVLTSIANAYREKHADVTEQARWWNRPSLMRSLSADAAALSPRLLEAIVKSALRMFDARNGGFGQRAEIPPSGSSRSSDGRLRTHRRRAGERTHSLVTLEHMANGGVYDQLAGGFHRYSVDERWVVPHFEKMCYDNSELLKNYVHGYQAQGTDFSQTWRGTSFAGWTNG